MCVCVCVTESETEKDRLTFAERAEPESWVDTRESNQSSCFYICTTYLEEPNPVFDVFPFDFTAAPVQPVQDFCSST